MMRIALFLGTNLAILALISITFRLLGIEGLLMQNGVDLDINALLVYSAVIGFSGSLISLFISKWMAKRSMGVQLIQTPGNEVERWLVATVESQAQRAGIGMPEVGIFNHASPNAFATGWNKNDALVAVSTGLMQQMNRDEVEAVLAHEVSHVANGDMVTLSLIQGVVNTFVVFLSRIIGHTVDRVVFKTERGYGPAFYIVSIIAEFVLGILAMTIVMWFSRWREFRADKGGADLAGRGKMIAALRRLQQAHEPEPMPEEMAAFAISAGKVQKLFASHPPLEDRIAALESV
ncbi:MAG: protease HtpX [Candidatus Thiodiazotropha lotti]|uniref:Protease HtpX n=1 Tax=Candidatus Thiodiazotropha lotti TaxID=2792787 RepID=A0A9E4K0J1_9GAMM|nr:protease HtpX [Candidatus Thiodiazotropha lotti]ODB99222.1 zinc metalloprotease HtpX [Candidatus Thiodiazotropha endoloripes]MCG7921212.1 protease HtpX [Candidatus Thiodiazotropha lotti]MCG7929228.1 protease HtpX [Candidatus Thiodiazotropha lotti]MCG7937225.1 protease HtpX [Candidatus Thiodiazotropha lotti]